MSRRGVEVQLYSFLNLGARCGWVTNATPRPFYPQERPGTHCVGGWVGPRAYMNGRGKNSSPPGIDPQTVKSVASRYTDYTIVRKVRNKNVYTHVVL